MDKAKLLKIIEKAAKDKATKLDLSEKDIRELPPEIVQLTGLTSLDLGYNQLTSLPPEIGQLTGLTSLDLGGNQLTSLPPEIGQLTGLTELYLGGNQLKSLPPEIGQLTSLTSLDLGFNKLTSLPPEIGQLTGLTSLYLRSNQLTSLSPEIVQLTGLTSLDLGSNQLTSLPPEIGQLTGLTSFYIGDNPKLKQPPPEIVDKGTKAVLKYLRELNVGREKQYRAKLIFVGEGAVGKTCTKCSLQGEVFNENQETTHGIDIKVDDLEIDHPTEKNVNMILNTWDFGGQRLYRATQQLFFTRRSLYVVCWNARKDPVQCELDFWLKTIKSLAPDSPVILLATHIDERAPDINYHKFQKKYPQLIANCAVSNKKGTGIEELLEVIQKAAAGLPQMGEAWPTSWLKAKEEIGKLEGHHIKRQDYIKICEDSKVDEDSIWTLASWLHDLGNILFYYDSSGLEDMVILEPEWITKAISKVLEDKFTRDKKQGILENNRLPAIWKGYDRNLYPAFLRLMEKFDLSYRIHGKDSSVVAELLPFEPPKFKWHKISELPKSESQLTMNFELNFVPAGVMTWFIVRTHRFTQNRHWRDGVYLEYDGHRAKAELDAERRVFTLEVQGIMPHYFFSILKDSVDVILNRFSGLQIERNMPCICLENNKPAGRCEHNFEYTNLVDFVEKNIDQAQCTKSGNFIHVNKLLYGIHPYTDNAVIEAIKQLEGKIDRRHEQMADLIIRNFLRIHNHAFAKLEADCPSLLTISPRSKGPFKEKRLFTEVYNVQLWCQMPGCSHPIVDGDYELKQPKDWLIKAKPWLSALLESLKYVELAAAVTGGFITQTVKEAVKDKIKVMEKVVGLIPDSKKEISERDFSDDYLKAAKVSGADLRAVSSLLHSLDESHHWGGLEKTISPEGDILWLCPKHYKVFDPGLPVL
ncbi:MAG: GTPase [candidate division Zixibacteria bacterium]|nr:GTPase [candidate division Zixibacteria bacterium]